MFLTLCALGLFLAAKWHKKRQLELALGDEDFNDQPRRIEKLLLILRSLNYREIFILIIELILLILKKIVLSLGKIFTYSLSRSPIDSTIIAYFIDTESDRKKQDKTCIFLCNCDFFQKIPMFKQFFVLAMSLLGCCVLVQVIIGDLLNHSELARYSRVLLPLAVMFLLYFVYF